MANYLLGRNKYLIKFLDQNKPLTAPSLMQ